MTSRLVAAAVFLLYVSALAAPRQAPPDPQKPLKITLRFINGKNGKPVTDENPNIFFDDADAASLLPNTDAHGEVLLDLPPKTDHIRMRSNLYADCRIRPMEDGIGAGEPIKYSVATIQSQGLVGGNVCGKFHAAPSPGVLVLYVRPWTAREKKWL